MSNQLVAMEAVAREFYTPAVLEKEFGLPGARLTVENTGEKLRLLLRVDGRFAVSQYIPEGDDPEKLVQQLEDKLHEVIELHRVSQEIREDNARG